MKGYLDNLYVLFRDEFASPEFEGILRSGCTLSVVLLHGQQADCLWAGDSPVYHPRPVKKGFETRLLTRPDHDREGCLTNCFGAYSQFSLHHCQVQLEAADIVTLTSDGIAVDEYTLGPSTRIKVSARWRFRKCSEFPGAASIGTTSASPPQECSPHSQTRHKPITLQGV